MSMPEGLLLLIAGLIFAFYLYTIFAVLRTSFPRSSDKGIWLAIVIIAPFIGTLIFWYMRPRIIRGI